MDAIDDAHLNDPNPVAQAAIPAPRLLPFIHVLDWSRWPTPLPTLNREIWDKSVITDDRRQQQLLLKAVIVTSLDHRRGSRHCGWKRTGSFYAQATIKLPAIFLPMDVS